MNLLNMSYSYWDSKEDYLRKAKELAGIIHDMNIATDSIAQVRDSLEKENFLINESLLMLALNLKDKE
jgi:hypothetical protein